MISFRFLLILLGFSKSSRLRYVIFILAWVGSEDALYKELWHACAGPLVTVPRQGELVYYFPQGHIEQVRFHLLSSSVISLSHPCLSYFFFEFEICVIY
jgi:hypothetical protein